MRRALLGLAVLAGGCGWEQVDCEQLAFETLTCDVRPAALTCDNLAPHEQRELADRIDEQGCDALWDEDGQRAAEDACDAFGWDCPAPLFSGQPAAKPRYPLVFVGGIDAREDFGWNPTLVQGVAERTGGEVHVVPLPSWVPTEERATALGEALDDLPSGAQRFNLICYAVGGIDCRYLVSPGGLDQPDRVATITTIATPHRGTDVANAALSLATQSATSSLVTALLGPDGEAELSRADTLLRETLRGLTNESALAFNETVVDAPEVSYRSWAAVSHVGDQPLIPTLEQIEAHCSTPGGELAYFRHAGTFDGMTELLWATAPFSNRTLASADLTVSSPSDGMIAVDSARWGSFGGCIPADHYDVIGQLGDQGPDPRTGFWAVGFYSQIAANLAAEGY